MAFMDAEILHLVFLKNDWSVVNDKRQPHFVIISLLESLNKAMSKSIDFTLYMRNNKLSW